jgi:hypothetical protein
MSTTAPGQVDASGSVGDDSNPAPSAGGRRRRDSNAPATFGRVRPPQRHRVGLSLIGIPVTTLIAVELIALCALLVAEKKLLVGAIAVTIGVIIVVAALLRRRSIRIGTWAVLRIAYLFRQRETLVAAAAYAGGRRRDEATPDDDLPAARGEFDDIEAPPELEAFFPGMTTWESRTHDGDRMGVVQWVGTCAATLRVGPPGGIVRARNTTENMPVAAIMGALEGQDLGLESVQVLTQTIVGEQDPQLSPMLASASAELGSGCATGPPSSPCASTRRRHRRRSLRGAAATPASDACCRQRSVASAPRAASTGSKRGCSTRSRRRARSPTASTTRRRRTTRSSGGPSRCARSRRPAWRTAASS